MDRMLPVMKRASWTGEEPPAQEALRLLANLPEEEVRAALTDISPKEPLPRDVVWKSPKPTSHKCFWPRAQVGKDLRFPWGLPPSPALPSLLESSRGSTWPLLTRGG